MTTSEAFRKHIESLARSYFDEEMSPAHDWFHIQRVRTNAETLVANYPSADATVVYLGAVLHDIGRAKERQGDVEDHAVWGATESESLLREHGTAADTSAAVAHCVRAHRYSTEPEPETIEAKIVSDADDLDALGAVGLARCFAHGGEVGSPIHDPSLPPEADDTVAGRTQLTHLRRKILDIPNRMHTDVGRELADERATYVQQFIQQFEKESSGAR